MFRGLSAGVLVLLSALAPAAEESEQLDADFLEYLAHMEGDDDDWTLVAQPAETPTAAAREAASQTSPSKMPPSKPPKPSKQADPPAVDER